MAGRCASNTTPAIPARTQPSMVGGGSREPGHRPIDDRPRDFRAQALILGGKPGRMIERAGLRRAVMALGRPFWRRFPAGRFYSARSRNGFVKTVWMLRADPRGPGFARANLLVAANESRC